MTHSLPRARRPSLRPRLWPSVAAAVLCLSGTGVHAAPLDDLRRQVDAGQFEAAWATAQAHPELIGDVHFDFPYGVAAINTGRVAEGLLALERHLAAVPANDRARLELATGYFLLGEYARARTEFEFVLRYNPPAATRNKINDYLQAMQLRQLSSRRGSARLYVEAGLGHDNNVNGGTSQTEVLLPLGPISLEGSPSRQVGDDQVLFSVGGQHQLRVSNRFSLIAGGDLEHRGNFQEKAYDLTVGGAYVGFTQLGANALWRVTLGGNEILVGGNRYRDTLQVQAEANFTLDADTGVQVFTQYGEQHFSAADEDRNARLTTLGAMLTRGYPDLPGAPSFGVRASWTQEHNLRQRPDLGRDTPLLRVFGSVSPMDRMRVTLSLTGFHQRYGAPDITGFGTLRKDNWLMLDGAVTYALDSNWSVRLDANWTRARSNQNLYISDRKAAFLKLRYQY